MNSYTGQDTYWQAQSVRILWWVTQTLPSVMASTASSPVCSSPGLLKLPSSNMNQKTGQFVWRKHLSQDLHLTQLLLPGWSSGMRMVLAGPLARRSSSRLAPTGTTAAPTPPPGPAWTRPGPRGWPSPVSRQSPALRSSRAATTVSSWEVTDK